MRKILSILLLIFLIAVIPLALILTKQRQEIRKKAATNDINVYLNANTLSPNGTTSGGVIVTVGTPVVDTATAHITYDSSKITLSHLACGSGLTSQFSQTTPGDLVIRCFKQGGFPAGPVAFALFDVQAGATVGDYTISLGQNTQLVSNSTVVTGNKVPATLHVTTTAVPVSFSFGTSSGTVKLIPGSIPITTAKLVFTYDGSKITVSGLACDANNFSSQSGLNLTPGKAEIICSSQTGVSGTASKNIASFNIVVSSGATGNVEINFSTAIGNSRLSKADSTEVPAQFTNGTFQITQAGIVVNPQCGNRGTAITITGPHLGTEGKVCLVKEATIGYPCGYNMATSRTNTQITATIPTNLRDDEITTPFLIRIETKASAGSSDYITPAPTLTVSTNCAVVTPPPTTAPPTATPRITPTPTPTATVDPNRPGVFSLEPASTTVGANPVLVEIKLNSGAKKVTTAQAIVLVDSKLSLVDASGNAVTEIIPGNTALSSLRVNRYASNVITYAASKASETAVASTINGVFAKFYVKTTQTTGTATISFRTGSTPEDSAILDENAVYILGRAQALTLNLGAVAGAPVNSITAGAVTTDSSGRYHVPLTLSANPAPALTMGGETAGYVVKIIGTGTDHATADATIAQTFATGDCTSNLPTVGKVYCSQTLLSTIDYIFNPGTDPRYIWVIFHNDSLHTAASYWSAYSTNSSWSIPVRTGVINLVPSGNTFTFKLKLAFLDSKPTTPNVTGADYEHHLARVTIKSGDTNVLEPTDVRMTVDTSGVWTSDPVSLTDVPAGTYKLYVKPKGYFQKRFTGVAFPPAGVINLSDANHANYKFEAGDVNNDGVVNLEDVNIAWNVIVKARAAEEGGTALVADDFRIDYDYNGVIVGGKTPGINAGDMAVILETLKTRYDDE